MTVELHYANNASTHFEVEGAPPLPLGIGQEKLIAYKAAIKICMLNER